MPAQVAKDAEEGVAMAQEVQRSGKATAALEKWIVSSQRAAQLEQQQEKQRVAAGGRG